MFLTSVFLLVTFVIILYTLLDVWVLISFVVIKRHGQIYSLTCEPAEVLNRMSAFQLGIDHHYYFLVTILTFSDFCVKMNKCTIFFDFYIIITFPLISSHFVELRNALVSSTLFFIFTLTSAGAVFILSCVIWYFRFYEQLWKWFCHSVRVCVC